MSNNNIESTRYAKHLLKAKFVFVVKDIQVYLDDKHIQMIREVFESICNQYDCKLLSLIGDSDNVQITVQFLPRTTLSTLVNSLKTVSSRKLRQSYSCFEETAIWNRSYLVLSLEDKINPQEITDFIKKAIR